MTKTQKRGALLLLTGLLLVSIALTIHLLQQKQDAIAGETADLLLHQLELNRLANQPNSTQPSTDQAVLQMPEKEYIGYRLLGSVQVPSVGIRLPVLSVWDEEMLKIAPCRYAGSLPDGNMIIMGHNYKSHFNPLHRVNVGDTVTFEDVQGKVYQFRVAKIESLHRDQGELLPSSYPLTLFTCSPGGIYRHIIRCENLN